MNYNQRIHYQQKSLDYANNGKTMPWVFMGYPSGWGENVVGADIQIFRWKHDLGRFS